MNIDVRESVLARFWKHVNRDGPGGCWLWTGAIQPNGYAKASGAGEQWAHRAMYALLVGPIGSSLTIDHLCRVRHCVNPDHLEAVTLEVNIIRSGTEASIAHATGWCKRGHAIAGDNVYRNSSGKQCLKCRVLTKHRARAAS